MNRRLSDQFQLRLPSGMRERIRVAAEKSERSMNTEIVEALLEKYPEPVDFRTTIRAARDVLRRLEKTNAAKEAGELKEALEEIEYVLSYHDEVGPADEDRDPRA